MKKNLVCSTLLSSGENRILSDKGVSKLISWPEIILSAMYPIGAAVEVLSLLY